MHIEHGKVAVSVERYEELRGYEERCKAIDIRAATPAPLCRLRWETPNKCVHLGQVRAEHWCPLTKLHAGPHYCGRCGATS